VEASTVQQLSAAAVISSNTWPAAAQQQHGCGSTYLDQPRGGFLLLLDGTAAERVLTTTSQASTADASGDSITLLPRAAPWVHCLTSFMAAAGSRGRAQRAICISHCARGARQF
jgi:hypothetical protein